jgi:lipopolysaccharide exporter
MPIRYGNHPGLGQGETEDAGDEDQLALSLQSPVSCAAGTGGEDQAGGVPSTPLFTHAVSSLKWSLGASAATLVLQLAYTVTVSRLVAPEAFGLVALGGVLLRFVSYFAQLGLGSAVIQRPELDERDMRVAFTASALMGLGVFAVAWVLAPVAAPLFSQDPRLVAVSRALSASFIFLGISATAQAVLSRALRFRVLAGINIASFVVGYLGIGIPLALAGAGVWSLVGATLGSSAVATVAALVYARHPMRPLYDRARLWSLLSFGGMVSVIGFFEFIGSSLDTLAVGRFAGTAALGNYGRATALVTPVERFATATAAVLYPNFARVNSDRERTAKAYLSGLALLSALILVPVACLAAAAQDVVSVLLGGRWHLAAELLPPIALGVGIGLITRFSGSVFEAMGILKPKLVIQAIHIATVFGVLALTVLWFDSAPIGFAVAWMIGEATRQAVYAVWLQRVLGIPARSTARRFAESALLAALPAVAVVLTRGALELPAAVELLASCSTAAMVLAAACVLLPNLTIRQEIRERQVLRAVFGRGSRS